MHQGFGDEKGMVPASTRRLATRPTPPGQVTSLAGSVFVRLFGCAGHNCQTQARVPRESTTVITTGQTHIRFQLPCPSAVALRSLLDRAVFRHRSTSGAAETRETSPPADQRQHPRCHLAPPSSAKLACLGEVSAATKRAASRRRVLSLRQDRVEGPPHQQTGQETQVGK